jgi:hypothetical protein
MRRIRETSQASKVQTGVPPAEVAPAMTGASALEKNLMKSKHDLQRLILGLFGKK